MCSGERTKVNTTNDISSQYTVWWIFLKGFILLLLQKLNSLKLKCITLASIIETPKIQKYYVPSKIQFSSGSASNNFYLKIEN